MTTGKSFDCVAMKHRAASEIHKELKGKSMKERLAYWRKQKRSMEKRIARNKAIKQKA
jgi:hypothetical protein